MSWRSAKVSRVLLVIAGLFAAAGVSAQLGHDGQAPERPRYDRRFFVQLRGVFGRFRDTDLQRAFDRAQPIQCSELINDEGEWRTVAFFNEKRELGDWYRSSLDEVKSDLAVFTFKGVCRGEHGPVQLTTKFPVTESIEAYNQKRIGLDEVDVNVNAPVRAAYDSQTQAYSFDLPYLFLVRQQDNESIYSLDPPRLAERYRYATDVIDHWDCKSVIADNVTYQFLICRTTTLPRDPAGRSQSRVAFGSSAYFILSDGKEASSSVKLTFNDAGEAKHTVEDASVPNPPDGSSALDAHESEAWEAPDSDEKILDVLRNEFRIRFAPQTWTGRIGAAEVLSGKKLSSLASATPASGADYCVWLPGALSSVNNLLANHPDEPITYGVTAHDQDGQSSTSIVFDMRTPAGIHLGTLQCVFPRASSAASIAFSRWASIAGDHLTLEMRP
jgi:hypothetical protein